MRRKWMKQAAALAMTALVMTGTATTTFAGQWKQDSKGWWWQNDDGSYPANKWEWLDGNKDGVAESYCFDASGYMLANITTPDGYTVNTDGQWTENGVVQTKKVEVQSTSTDSAQSTAKSGTYSTSEYDNNGISLAALDMFEHTREENAKYVETKASEDMDMVYVWYENGLGVQYSKGNYNDNKGRVYQITDNNNSFIHTDYTRIFKYAADSKTEDGLLKSLKARGYDCYSNGNIHVTDLKSDVDSHTYSVTIYIDQNEAYRVNLTRRY